MSGRVQGPPRGQVPSLPTVLWTLFAIVGCLFSTYLVGVGIFYVVTSLFGGGS